MTEVHHTGITVSDLERSVGFYCSAFGLEETRRVELGGEAFEEAVGVPGAEVELAMLAGGNTVVELLQYKTSSGKPFTLKNNDVGSAHLCFTVDNIEAVYGSLVEKGVPGVAAPSEAPEAGPAEGTRFAYLLDPDGITVELLEVGPGTNLKALGVTNAQAA
ncbi:MAG: VOC family protein [Solirubrobacterales bacterium]|nr:VOC family protein [Solirubrobacterales bacterium]